MAKRIKPGTRLTADQVIAIARAVVERAGGGGAAAKNLGVSRQAIFAALTGETRSHALLERIVRELAGVAIGERETVTTTFTTWVVERGPGREDHE